MESKQHGDTSPKHFQLEAIADDGNITRLQAEGEVPEKCLHDDRHKLEIVSVLECYPPIYVVRCNCGYRAQMQNPNETYQEAK